MENIEMKAKEKQKEKIYVRYDEGAERYSMCKHTFMKLAADAHAVYKINRLILVNTKIFEDYLETYKYTNSRRLNNGKDGKTENR